MQSFRLPRTILNLAQPRLPSLRDGVVGATVAAAEDRQADETTISPEIDEELKLPKTASLVIVLLSNVLLQVCRLSAANTRWRRRSYMRTDGGLLPPDHVLHYRVVVQ